MLFVRFEDMKADPAKTIRRIAEHIGAPTDDDLIDRVVSSARLQHDTTTVALLHYAII